MQFKIGLKRRASSGALLLEVQEGGGNICSLAFRHPNRPSREILLRQPGKVRHPFDASSWFMGPYSPGRLCSPAGKAALLHFQGKDYRFHPENFLDSEYALHGPACWLHWKLDESTPDNVIKLTAQALTPVDGFTPWPFAATVEYVLDGGKMIVRRSIKNVGGRDMPLAYGDHPFWQLSPSGIPSEVPVVSFSASHLWPKAEGILLPKGEPKNVMSEFDPNGKGGPIPFGLDHAYTGVKGEIRIHWLQSKLSATIRPDPSFTSVVVFTPERDHAAFGGTFALEPGHAPNAANLHAMGLSTELTGFRVLPPGKTEVSVWSVEIADVEDGSEEGEVRRHFVGAGD